MTDTDDLTVQPKRADRTLGELFGEMTAEIGTLFRKEVELAKVEGREELRRAGVAAGAFAGAAVAGLLALIMLSTAAAWLLDEWMHPALAFLIVGALWAIDAAAMYSIARRRAREVEPLPQTTDTLKENIEWAKTQTN